MEVERIYILKLEENDAISLKKILGSMTDPEFASKGVEGEGRERMRDLWDLLPHEPEEE